MEAIALCVLTLSMLKQAKVFLMITLGLQINSALDIVSHCGFSSCNLHIVWLFESLDQQFIKLGEWKR